MIGKLRSILDDMDLLIRHSKTEDGKVRNAKLMLAASREMRQGLETAVKLKESLRQEEDLHRFNDAVLAEIRKESPECAERIAMRVGPVAQRWAAEGPPPG